MSARVRVGFETQSAVQRGFDTIAQRVVAISDPFENMGARLARHLAWHVRQEVGDGRLVCALAERVVYLHGGQERAEVPERVYAVSMGGRLCKIDET